jgi:mono/diheme cytochrome c family protein
MKGTVKTFVLALVLGFASGAYAADVSEGKSLFQGEKYRCYSCHGKNGEGADAPGFKGFGKKYSRDEMMKRAAHKCPPTGACNPKELEAIVSYLRTI